MNAPHSTTGRRGTRIRRSLALAAAVGLVASLATACSKSSSAAEDGGFTLHVGIVTKVGVDGVLGWAENQKILEHDLAPLHVTKVEFSTFATGPTLNAALTSGSVDVASQGDTPALTLKSNGFDSRALAISGINSDYWLIGRKGAPSTLAALAGKKVSAAPGTAPEQYLIELLKQQKLTDKIKISHLQTNDAAAAVRSGSIDAFVASGAMAATLVSQGYPVIDKASDHTGLYTSSVNIASTKFLDKHPGFAAAWGKAFTASVASIKAHPDAYWAFAAKQEKVPVDIAKVANPLTSYPDGPFTPTGIKQLTASYDFLKQQGLLKAAVDVNAWLAKS